MEHQRRGHRQIHPSMTTNFTFSSATHKLEFTNLHPPCFLHRAHNSHDLGFLAARIAATHNGPRIKSIKFDKLVNRRFRILNLKQPPLLSVAQIRTLNAGIAPVRTRGSEPSLEISLGAFKALVRRGVSRGIETPTCPSDAHGRLTPCSRRYPRTHKHFLARKEFHDLRKPRAWAPTSRKHSKTSGH